MLESKGGRVSGDTMSTMANGGLDGAGPEIVDEKTYWRVCINTFEHDLSPEPFQYVFQSRLTGHWAVQKYTCFKGVPRGACFFVVSNRE